MSYAAFGDGFVPSSYDNTCGPHSAQSWNDKSQAMECLCDNGYEPVDGECAWTLDTQVITGSTPKKSPVVMVTRTTIAGGAPVVQASADGSGYVAFAVGAAVTAFGFLADAWRKGELG